MTIAFLALRRCLNVFGVLNDQIRLTTTQSGALKQAHKAREAAPLFLAEHVKTSSRRQG
jgi:hypothetical protein